MSNPNPLAVRPSEAVKNVSDAALHKVSDDATGTMSLVMPCITQAAGVAIVVQSPFSGGGAITLTTEESIEAYIQGIRNAYEASKKLWATEPTVPLKVASLLSKAESARSALKEYETQAAALEAETLRPDVTATEDEEAANAAFT
jgi:hypothetical protein